MRMHSFSLLTLFCSLLLAGQARAEVNPDYTFFVDGDTPQGWHWVLGDPEQWWHPLEGNEGESASGKLTVEPASFQGENDAIKATWHKGDTWASLVLSGRTTNLAAFEHKAELVIIARVDRKPKNDVKLALDCGENCRAEISIQEQLNQAERKQWFVLPVALNCFTAAGAKLDTVTAPLSIGTNSRMELSIASVQVQALKEGETGCAAAP